MMLRHVMDPSGQKAGYRNAGEPGEERGRDFVKDICIPMRMLLIRTEI